MVLHERYCIRNLYKCEKCGQPVEKAARDSHNLEFHTPVPCPHCNEPQEKTKLDDHVVKCPKRPKMCEYCELELPFDQYSNHVDVCGSKTIQCRKCNRYIQKKYWQEHQSILCEPEIVIPIEHPKSKVDRKSVV